MTKSNNIPKFVKMKDFNSNIALTSSANLFSTDSEKQLPAVHDCISLGFSDERTVLILRYSLRSLEREALRTAIYGLGLFTFAYPGVPWSAPEEEQVNETIREKVASTFKWSFEEIQLILDATDTEDWTPGGIGSMAFLLIREDDMDNFYKKLRQVLFDYIYQGKEQLAGHVLAILADRSGEACKGTLDEIKEIDARITKLPNYSEILNKLDEQGSFKLYGVP